MIYYVCYNNSITIVILLLIAVVARGNIQNERTLDWEFLTVSKS